MKSYCSGTERTIDQRGTHLHKERGKDKRGLIQMELGTQTHTHTGPIAESRELREMQKGTILDGTKVARTSEAD